MSTHYERAIKLLWTLLVGVFLVAALAGCTFPALDLRTPPIVTVFEPAPGTAQAGFAPLQVVFYAKAESTARQDQTLETCVDFNGDGIAEACDGDRPFVYTYEIPGDYRASAWSCYKRVLGKKNCSEKVYLEVNVLKKGAKDLTYQRDNEHITVLLNAPDRFVGRAIYIETELCVKVQLSKLFVLISGDEDVVNVADYHHALFVSGDRETTPGCYNVEFRLERRGTGEGWVKVRVETASRGEGLKLEIRHTVISE